MSRLRTFVAPLLAVGLLAVAAPAAAGADGRQVHAQAAGHPGTVRGATVEVVRFLGQQRLPDAMEFQGTTVGGLSGIDYAPRRDTWYVVSDDRSALDPARFYTADLDFQAGTGKFTGVTLTGTTPMRRPDGSTYPPVSRGTPVDPEAIRYDPRSGTLFWTSEGARALETSGDPLLADPFVRQMTTNGHFVRELNSPDHLRMRPTQRGSRQNLALEGLTLARDGRRVVAAMEGPLFQDGPTATARHGATTRIVVWNKRTGKPVKEYAYPLDPLPCAPEPATAFAVNGVSEILSVDKHRYLVLERAFCVGVGNSIRIYEVDTRGATNVLHHDALEGTPGYQPVSKELVLELGPAGTPKPDNIEGMTWGPRLPGGQRVLVLVADNNFSASQVTQFLAYAVRVQSRWLGRS